MRQPTSSSPRRRGAHPIGTSPAEHAARVDAEVASAVAAFDAWHGSDSVSSDLDLSDHPVIAQDVVRARAAEVGATVANVPGRRVVLRVTRAAAPVPALTPGGSARARRGTPIEPVAFMPEP